MYFRLGAPTDDNIELSDPTMLITAPMKDVVFYGCIAGGVLFLLLFLPTGLWSPLYEWTNTATWWEAILVLFGVPVVHEALHMVAYQGLNWKRRGTFGLLPKACAAYAYYPFVVSRRKFLCAVMLPTLVLTILPLSMALMNMLLVPLLLPVAAFNAMSCGGDLYIVWRTIRTVPPGKHFQSSGMSEYWGDPA